MKKYGKVLAFTAVLIIMFIAVSGLTFKNSKKLIEEGYLASEGSAAENFAVLAAANIRLSDEQVEKLRECSYSELMKSDENADLAGMMSNSGFAVKVDYAYIMVHLKDDEVKYKVTEETADKYDAPVGTKLDIMWLLDVNVSDEAAANQDMSSISEIDRYSYYIDEDSKIFGSKPTYIFNSSEWGDHICGYAPIYSTSGAYIGVLGVELRTGDFNSYCDRAVLAMGAVLIISLLMLSILFVYIYTGYKRSQFDRIFIDPLTGVYNRSYYNTRFTRRLNSRRNGRLFALMIADVDWFKKVNDTFGHEIGDEVLTEIGQLLVEVFGKEQVVRFGGEEFVVGIWVNDESTITDLLEKLYKNIAEHRFSTRDITLTISTGCAYFAADTLDGWLLSGMLRAADCKLYEAKENGRNKYLLESYDTSKHYRKQPTNFPKRTTKNER